MNLSVFAIFSWHFRLQSSRKRTIIKITGCIFKMLSKPSANKYLQVTDDEIRRVREKYGVTKETLDADISSILEWFQMQPHLPDVELDRDFVERVYILQKCSSQRTKSNLDMKYTCKMLAPEFFMNRNTRSPALQAIMENTSYVLLPKLTPDLCRVTILKANTPNAETFNNLHLLQLSAIINEIGAKEDYPLGHRFILDCANSSPAVILKVNPVLISKADTIFRRAMGYRVSGIHIINGNKVMEKLIFILKQCLPPKIADRIHIHNSLEDLHEIIPSKYLPKDYGGEMESIKELSDGWLEYLKSDEIWQYFKEQDKYVTDEDKRPAEMFDAEIMGMPGSFKKLSFD